MVYACRMASQLGLRERKKQRMRQQIADTAAALFAERGFEHVTIAEIAAAAEVDKKTVFNYFPAKEDLYFDQDQAMETGLIAAVRDRPPGESVLDACRRFYTQGLAQMPDQAASGPLAAHVRILAASPALQARQREIFHRHEQALAREIAAATGANPDQLEPRVTAAAILGAIRALQERGLAQLASGHFHPSPATLRDDLNAAFDLLANGLGSRGTTGDHPGRPHQGTSRESQ
jgi:AcrR family transcriptional regulator